MEPFFKARQLVEVSGLKDEGFPGSFVLAVVLETDNEAATVQYMEVKDRNQSRFVVAFTLLPGPVFERAAATLKSLAVMPAAANHATMYNLVCRSLLMMTRRCSWRSVLSCTGCDLLCPQAQHTSTTGTNCRCDQGFMYQLEVSMKLTLICLNSVVLVSIAPAVLTTSARHIKAPTA